MHRLKLTFLFLMFLTASFGQKLIYKSNGNIYDSNNHRISPSQIREMYSGNTPILDLYNEGRTKKTVGNVLLIGGVGMLVTDVLIGANADVEFPSALTYLGVVSVLIAIPVKIGFSKKVKKSVDDYNDWIKRTGYIYPNNIEFIANTNGLGFRFSLN